MRALELLIEDYERRLKTITESIEKNRSNGSIVHQRREERLNTKASEYRTFIAELQRAMADVASTESKLNMPVVSGSLPIEELKSKLLSMRFSKEEIRAADNEKALEMYGFTDCINQLLEWLQPKRQ